VELPAGGDPDAAPETRAHADGLLRRSEERYRLVALATNDVVWDWDLVTGHVDWNEMVLRQFGCTREELGHAVAAWTERIHPADLQRVLHGIYGAIEGRAETWSDEYRFRKNDGTHAIFLDRGFIVRDAGGKAVRMIGSMLDVSEQRRVEAALRESDDRFRALADNMSQLAWIADAHGTLLWANKRWLEYTGITPEDARRGDAWLRLIHPDHVDGAITKFQRHLVSGEPWEDTFLARHVDGGYRWFLSRALPIRDERGALFRWFGTNTDITEQREAEEALREADRHKDEFLAMLAHELRNPLAPIRNAIHVLRVVAPREPTLDRLRDVIDRQVTHMARLIDDLLDVSRIARGRVELRKERHDIAQIVRQTAEDYRENLEGSGLSVSVDVEGAPLCVDGDGTRLAQIVGNLLHNAGKFTDRGGSVRVGVRRDASGSSALVSVEDTGVGIEPAVLARLFDPFSQAAQGLARSKGGLGLGLALAKALAELHGGSVSAQSDGLGRGSTFVVRLPLVRAAGAGTPSGATTPAKRLRILVIEDNADAAETLEMVLALAGHDVKVALDGRTGIEMARALRPDVVICDIGLPGGVDGYDVGRALRSEPALRSISMIALSGYSQDEDRRRSREAGFDAHLAKPAEVDKLTALLADVRRA
jgi:PAS domain S-box-containing protein